jgi:hypothetical protein
MAVHASWLNQVEIYFSIIQRKVLTPSDFAGLADLKAARLAFLAAVRRFQVELRDSTKQDSELCLLVPAAIRSFRMSLIPQDPSQ